MKKYIKGGPVQIKGWGVSKECVKRDIQVGKTEKKSDGGGWGEVWSDKPGRIVACGGGFEEGRGRGGWSIETA